MSDASQRKLRNMLEILIMLGTSRYGRTKKSLAEHFGISLKTIDRYIETFKNVGFVIDYEKGSLKINKEKSNYKDLSELLYFSDDESLILKKAIDSIDASTELKEQLKQKLYSIYNFDRVATPLAKKHHSKIIQKLLKAIEENKQVFLINYNSANSQNIKDRLVEPFEFTSNFSAVWAYEQESNTNKTFKIDRISKVKILPQEMLYKEKHKKNDVDVFRMSSNVRIPVKLQLTLKAKSLLVEEFPRAEKYIEKINENNYLLETQVHDLKGIGRFVLGLPEDITIEYPNELKHYVYKVMLNNYKKFEI